MLTTMGSRLGILRGWGTLGGGASLGRCPPVGVISPPQAEPAPPLPHTHTPRGGQPAGRWSCCLG